MTRSADDIVAELAKIVQSIIESDVEIAFDTDVVESEILDSLDFMDYVLQVQQTYGVVVTDEDLAERNLELVSNMVQFVEDNAPG